MIAELPLSSNLSTKRTFKCQGIFTFLIILLMTVSSFGQISSISFQISDTSGILGTVTFGTSDGTDENNYPYWIDGSDGTSSGYTLYVENNGINDNDPLVWALRQPTSQTGNGIYPNPNYIPGPRFFYLPVDESICTGNWIVDNIYADFTVVVTCPPTNNPDVDGDGYDASVDCNDNDASVNSTTTYYVDNDGDGYGTIPEDICSTTLPMGYAAVGGDCNDTVSTGGAAIYPGATEICDGLDNNCDGNIDEGTITTYYADSDMDGYGDPANTTDSCSANAPAGFVTDNTDCDDTNGDINPGETEVCDGLDNNCDGNIDEGLSDCETNQDIYEYCDGEKKTKVIICHNGKDKCVSINAVDAHLAHGDTLGSCNSGKNGNNNDDLVEGEEELPTSYDVAFWPNPSNSSFNVKMITPNVTEKVSIEAFDINGRLVHSNKINGNQDYQFGNNFSTGLYIVKLTQVNTVKMIKVVKQ